MWLTGFDVPSLATLYLDKPLKAHTLMQAIARANRVNEGKNNGLIVDYCGILKNLRKALATFAGYSGGGDRRRRTRSGARRKRISSKSLMKPSRFIWAFLTERNVRPGRCYRKVGFERNAALTCTKKRSTRMTRPASASRSWPVRCSRNSRRCLTMQEVSSRRPFYAAINFIYKSLQDDREQADISHIIRELHKVIAEAVQPSTGFRDVDQKIYDISAIDFERLRQEFDRSPKKNT